MIVQNSIEKILQDSLHPSHLDVVNESHMHSVPPNSETHFKVVLVSGEFEGQRKVARHQQVYRLLQQQMADGVHALALHTYTPEEWQQRQQAAPSSPQCLGGSKSN